MSTKIFSFIPKGDNVRLSVVTAMPVGEQARISISSYGQTLTPEEAIRMSEMLKSAACLALHHNRKLKPIKSIRKFYPARNPVSEENLGKSFI